MLPVKERPRGPFCALLAAASRAGRGNSEDLLPSISRVISMSTRSALVLLGLVALVLAPLAGCTPPASQDVQFVSQPVAGTDTPACCATGAVGHTGTLANYSPMPGMTGQMPYALPGATAGSGALAVALPNTTAGY